MFNLLLLGLANSLVVRTHILDHVRICGIYSEPFSSRERYEIINYEVDVLNYMNMTYGRWTFREKLKEIIIVKENNNEALFCSPSVIVLKKMNDYKSGLTRALMNLINYNIIEFDGIWDNLNEFYYTNYNIKRQLNYGFLTSLGMLSRKEDMASFFEELMDPSYADKYDPIMISKFKLLYKILITFSREFEGIIKNRIMENNMLPNNEFVYISSYQRHMNEKANREIFFGICGLAFLGLVEMIRSAAIKVCGKIKD
jgi:hypothetical protein